MGNQPPKLKTCKKCPYNIGDDKTGLCATCDPNYHWWKKSDKKLNECIHQISIMTIEELRKTEVYD